MFVSPTPWPATVAAKQVAGGRSVRPIEQTTNTARRMMSRRGTPASLTLGARQGFAGAKPLRSAARCARLRRAAVGARLGAAARPTPVAGRMDSCSRCDNADGLMKPHPCVCTAAPGVEAGIGRGWAGEGVAPKGREGGQWEGGKEQEQLYAGRTLRKKVALDPKRRGNDTLSLRAAAAARGRRRAQRHSAAAGVQGTSKVLTQNREQGA